MSNTLGDELSKALLNITSLIIKTASSTDRKLLTEKQAEIAGRLQIFVDKIVDDTLPEYDAAKNALKAANDAAVAAKKNLDKVADTILKFATACDKLAELATKVVAF